MTVSSRTNPPRVAARSTMSPAPVGCSIVSAETGEAADPPASDDAGAVDGAAVGPVVGPDDPAAQAPTPSAATRPSATRRRAGAGDASGGHGPRTPGSSARFPCHNRAMARDLQRPLREAWIVDAVRTPIGRYGGALATVRPDDLAAVAIGAIVERTGIDPGAHRGRRARLRERGGRGQPQRRPHGGPPRRAAGRGRRADREPAVRLGPPGGEQRRPRDRGGGRRRVRRGRRRVDDAGAVRDAQGRGRVGSRRPDDGGHDARLAVRQPAHAARPTRRSRSARPPSASPSSGRSRASARTRSRSRASAGPSPPSRPGGSTASSCP